MWRRNYQSHTDGPEGRPGNEALLRRGGGVRRAKSLSPESRPDREECGWVPWIALIFRRGRKGAIEMAVEIVLRDAEGMKAVPPPVHAVVWPPEAHQAHMRIPICTRYTEATCL